MSFSRPAVSGCHRSGLNRAGNHRADQCFPVPWRRMAADRRTPSLHRKISNTALTARFTAAAPAGQRPRRWFTADWWWKTASARPICASVKTTGSQQRHPDGIGQPQAGGKQYTPPRAIAGKFIRNTLSLDIHKIGAQNKRPHSKAAGSIVYTSTLLCRVSLKMGTLLALIAEGFPFSEKEHQSASAWVCPPSR